ncbi:MAG: hypothetical protein HQL82_03455 [Magnetococcales bacterium]|nr:hypothetical protein [Magnetococcales bacterium]
MIPSRLREQLSQEIEKIPDDRLGEVLTVLRSYLPPPSIDESRIATVTVTTVPDADPKPKRRRPSPLLANQGARLIGDDIEPVLPLEDWGTLYMDTEDPRP